MDRHRDGSAETVALPIATPDILPLSIDGASNGSLMPRSRARAKSAGRSLLIPGASTMSGGRLGPMKVIGDNVMLDVPFTFTKDNVDGFNY